MADQLDFQKIYEEYFDKIHRYLIKLIGYTEAEDLTQDVFLKVQIGLDKFKGDSKISTWSYKVATNTAIDSLRRPSNRRIIRSKPVNDNEDAVNIEPEDQDIWSGEKPLNVEQEFVQNEMNRCIKELVDKLSPDFRAVVLLSEENGLKDREIAEVLGISLNTVKIRLHRARCALKKKMEKTCNFYHNERNLLSCEKNI